MLKSLTAIPLTIDYNTEVFSHTIPFFCLSYLFLYHLTERMISVQRWGCLWGTCNPLEFERDDVRLPLTLHYSTSTHMIEIYVFIKLLLRLIGKFQILCLISRTYFFFCVCKYWNEFRVYSLSTTLYTSLLNRLHCRDRHRNFFLFSRIRTYRMHNVWV